MAQVSKTLDTRLVTRKEDYLPRLNGTPLSHLRQQIHVMKGLASTPQVLSALLTVPPKALQYAMTAPKTQIQILKARLLKDTLITTETTETTHLQVHLNPRGAGFRHFIIHTVKQGQ